MAGAGKESGALYQTIWADRAGSSFLPPATESLVARGAQRLTPMITVDDALDARPSFAPELVKLDVQGFELEVLKGAQRHFQRTEVFILETSLFRFLPNQPLAVDCIHFMEERGYDIYDVTGFLRRPYDNALGQIDLAFAKRAGKLRRSNSWNACAPE